MGNELNDAKSVIETRVVHSVHRKAISLLTEGAARLSTPSEALREIRDFLVATLRHHHESEDEKLWPMIIAADPQVSEPLRGLSDEHEKLEASLVALQSLTISDALERSVLVAAAGTVRHLLYMHLEHEEPVLLPALRNHVSEEAWEGFSAYVLRTVPEVEHHLMPGLMKLVATPQEAEVLFGSMPDGAGAVLAQMIERAEKTLDALQA